MSRRRCFFTQRRSYGLWSPAAARLAKLADSDSDSMDGAAVFLPYYPDRYNHAVNLARLI